MRIDDNTLDNAFNVLKSEIKNKERAPEKYKAKSNEDVILDKEDELEKKILALMTRQKRSILSSPNGTNTKANGTVKFYHTVDELNEDTLRNANESGTIQAKKVIAESKSKITRRIGTMNQSSLSSNNPLHIEYTQGEEDHLAENKIDVTTSSDDAIHPKLSLTNYTQEEKNKDLSKLIVNELKMGKTEVLGGRNAPVVSNITFTPENDTLTAMAFIAGNLLNKLWNMEKEASDDPMETEKLKHEKISDLLDLYKEPLSLRQEAFLKNALEKLSEALDSKKDSKDISLCDNIEEAQRILKEAGTQPWEKTEIKEPRKEVTSFVESRKKLMDENKRNATSIAINKINNVLELIKKFETTNRKLNDMKKSINNSNLDITLRSYPQKIENLTDNENLSINLYGNLLEKITKLLLPNKRGKKIIKRIQSQNVFGNNADIKKKFMESYNIDLSNMTLSNKDKLLLDYLTILISNPKLLNEKVYQENINGGHTIEGDILLNLSEFFKIKSFVDLIKLVGSDNMEKTTPKEDNYSHLHIATTATYATADITEIIDDTTTVTTGTGREKLNNTKGRLREHLKSILDDLIELQKEKGIPAKEGEIKLADALPCIYNIINSGNEIQSKLVGETNTMQKIATIFDSIKKEMTKLTRRTDTDNKPRAKSTIVWERIVQNLEKKEKQKNRRNLDIGTPTFKELKIKMDQIQSRHSNAYKNYALFSVVPATEQLMLLKTQEADVMQYIDVLSDIELSLDNIGDKHNVVKDFVENAITNINLIEKVFKNVEKKADLASKVGKEIYIRKQELKMPINTSIKNNKKLSREEILTQLIKNRVDQYLKLREANGSNLEGDLTYSIAKNIISSLENGNYRLAKELYKVFVSTKNPMSGKEAPAFYKPAKGFKRQQLILDKEPLIQFEESKSSNEHTQAAFQDQLVKQLLNLKNMRV